MKILVMQHQSGDRYRTVQYFKSLEKEGLSFLDPHWDVKNQWNRWLEHARQVDVVWIARRLLSSFKLAALKRANPSIVFDFDDALWLRSSRRGSRPALSKVFKFNRMLESARQVMVGNRFLAQRAQKIVSPDFVTLIPTTVNRDWYQPRTLSENKDFVVGWIGSQSTLHYLENLRPVFEAFHSLGLPWKLKIVSDVFPDWSHLPVEKKQWKLEDENQDLQDMDVGLNPLNQDDWSRGKCALKVLQYMAVGTPVLATPVGVNHELVSDSQNGFLVSTVSQWFDRLLFLFRNREAAHEMGLKGRSKMWDCYTMEAQASNVLTVLKRAQQ